MQWTNSGLVQQGSADFDERGVFFRAFDKVERAQEPFLVLGRSVLVQNELGQQNGRLGRTRPPNKLAASGSVPAVSLPALKMYCTMVRASFMEIAGCAGIITSPQTPDPPSRILFASVSTADAFP